MGCFDPLKRAYSGKIADLACNATTYITKMNFLAAFQKTYFKAITPENICSSFCNANLILFDLEAVILHLDIRV